MFGLAGNDRLLSAGDGARDTVRGGDGADSADADNFGRRVVGGSG